jgi:hypothetical protein
VLGHHVSVAGDIRECLIESAPSSVVESWHIGLGGSKA